MCDRFIGCGTAYRGDDAAGLLVVRRLRELGIEAYEHSGEGLALIESWQGLELVVLVDSVVTGRDPGAITAWDGKNAPVILDCFRSSTHGFGVAEALRLAQALDLVPPRLLIYGIEGRKFDLGCAPSSEVVASSVQLAQRLAAQKNRPASSRRGFG
jgi:hydrogenase maturation protease